MRPTSATLAVLAAAAAFTAPASAQLRLASPFGDHMVLQRDGAALWGTAAPGAEVVVAATWDDSALAVRADEAGAFRVALATPGAGGPHSLTVRSGEDEVELHDVLIGDVWLCSGQSNMEWSLRKASDPDATIAAATVPGIRLFMVANTVAAEPASDCEGAWQPCDPASAADFSAVGYWFGRRLHRDLGVPIGLISADWGGTPAESWTSAEGLEEFAEFRDGLAALADLGVRREELQAEYEAERAAWPAAFDAADGGIAHGWHDASHDDGGWQTVDLPARFDALALDGFDGVVWYRRRFDVPAAWAGTDLALELGAVDDADVTFWNGERIGATTRHDRARRYTVPGRLVDPGPVTIAVRAYDSGGVGGFTGGREAMKVAPIDRPAEARPLAGPWRWRQGAAASALPRPPRAPSIHPHTPSSLFNGMIAPLRGLGLRGVIWYQGESNRTRHAQYRRLFPALIRDWRRQWRQELPFYFVQIAPYRYADDTGQAALLREAQAMATSLPATGMAATVDVGDPANIHPGDKRTVGNRLALCALAGTYGRDVVFAGPTYDGMAVETDRIRLRFRHVHGGLECAGERLTCFTIAGADGRFVPADAVIDGATVVVSSAAVAQPVAVRFAWGAADEPNLRNGAGLPAPPFRTDDW